jgi:hypothetical protein
VAPDLIAKSCSRVTRSAAPASASAASAPSIGSGSAPATAAAACLGGSCQRGKPRRPRAFSLSHGWHAQSPSGPGVGTINKVV